MALDLAYLVLERCPLRGQLFRALLIIALDADDRDFSGISVRKLARWGRTSKRHAQEMYEELQKQGWLSRPGMSGQTRHRRLVLRRKLLLLPAIPELKGCSRAIDRRFAGHHVHTLERFIIEKARQSAEDLRAFYDIRPGAHLPK